MWSEQTRRREIDPETARAVIEEWCSDAGVSFSDHMPAAAVLALLKALQYDACGDTIAEFRRKGYASIADSAYLTPVEVLALIQALDGRRRWRAAPSAHDVKKSAARLAIERCKAEGEDAFVDLSRYSVEDLLLFT